MVNVRHKGAGGERQVCDMLNHILYGVMKEMGHPESECLRAMESVQRNQNQSAVGGGDLTNTFGLLFEVKRQETLAVNQWWKQCCEAARRNGEHPVLIFRQNGKRWRIVTNGWLDLGGGRQLLTRLELDEDAFRAWYRAWVVEAIRRGEPIRF